MRLAKGLFDQISAKECAKAGIPYVKSEPEPKNNNGPVTTLVGTSFNDIVKDNNKDVLVQFHAPWCGHCVRLMPVWDELGEAFSDNENIIIARFDTTLNEVKGLAIN